MCETQVIHMIQQLSRRTLRSRTSRYIWLFVTTILLNVNGDRNVATIGELYAEYFILIV